VVKAAGLSRAGLLSTNFTMERGFYRDRLEATHYLMVLVPGEADWALLADHRTAGRAGRGRDHHRLHRDRVARHQRRRRAALYPTRLHA
jgi:hypothetical protein